MSIVNTIDLERATEEEFAAALHAASVLWAERAARGNEFARGKADTCLDVSRKLRTYGRWASERQKEFAKKLILWLRPREVRADASTAGVTAASPTPGASGASGADRTVVSGTAMTRIRALFDAARSHGLQHPAIHVNVPAEAITGLNTEQTAGLREVGLRLTLATERSNHPGCIYVTTSHRSRRERRYLGRIIPAGDFLRGHECDATRLGAIRAFGDDPLRIARAHGHATGVCCFCRRTLTDARSVAMGYGPICAAHYGLEWGDQRASSVVELNPQWRQLQEARHRTRSLLAQALAHDSAQGGLNYTDEDEQFQ